MTDVEQVAIIEDIFVAAWMMACELRGIKHIDRPESNTRTLAKVLAITIVESRKLEPCTSQPINPG